MKHNVVALSIEELAYAMGVLGGADAATGYLLGILGQRPRQEVEGRLLAAAHGLVARSYLDFDATTGSSWLTDQLAEMIKPVARNDYTLRMSRISGGREEIATLYVSGEGLVLHQLHQSVVSHLLQVPDLASAQEQCLIFFDLSNDSELSTQSLAKIPADLVDDLRRNDQAQPVEVAISELVSHGLRVEQAAKLANDLRNHDGRGSIARLETQGDEVVSQRGMLVLKGVQRSWLFNILPAESGALEVFSGSPVVFGKLFTALTS